MAITKIGQVIKVFEENYYVEEDFRKTIEIVLAVTVSVPAGGEPIWLFIIEASSGSKTEILRALETIEHGNNNEKLVVSRDRITPRALVSGRPNRSFDLLNNLDNKVFAIKDFTTLLTMWPQDLAEIMGQLRAIYDGKYEADFGTTRQPKRYEAHFHMLAAVTPDIEAYHEVRQRLGERFNNCRLHTENRIKLGYAAFDNLELEVGDDDEERKNTARRKVQEAVKEFVEYKIQNAHKMTKKCITGEYRRNLVLICDFCCKGRTAIIREKKSKDLIYEPTPEQPGRLVRQIAKLLAAICYNADKKIVGDREFRMAMKIALDSIPYPRLKVLNILYDKTEFNKLGVPTKGANQTFEDILRTAKTLPKVTIRNAIEDLYILGLITIEYLPYSEKDKEKEKETKTYSLNAGSASVLSLYERHHMRTREEEMEAYANDVGEL